jgi:putative Mg2+ transporter-C (MgtC) family protein
MIDFPSSNLEFFLRPLLAVVLAGVLGWERETHDKPAGLRTMMMVGLGSAAFTTVVFWVYAGILTSGLTQRADPLRIVEGVVGGIGFLGAGSIIQSRGSVQGMTTAATIWVVGSIGVACGVGQYGVAGIVTLYAWLILWLVGFLEHRSLRLKGSNDSNADREGPTDGD